MKNQRQLRGETKVTGQQSWKLVLLFGLLVTLLIASSPAKCRTPSTADCMKNPFATGCRGISAKRSIGSTGNLLMSQQQQQQQQQQKAFAAIASNLENTLLPAIDKWPASSLARRLISANLILASMQPAELSNELAWWSSINSANSYCPCARQLEQQTGTE